MPSLATMLRKACVVNKLGASGSSEAMLKRILKAADRSSAIAKKSKQMSSKQKHALLKRQQTAGASKRVPYKPTKSGGMRMSAAFYFYDHCDGKISRCKPQRILQPDGRVRLKEIRIVNGAHGPNPKWVNVQCI